MTRAGPDDKTATIGDGCPMIEVKRAIDLARQKHGFMSLAETAALMQQRISVLDPHSTLIAVSAVLEPGVVLWSGTAIEADATATVTLGSGTVLFPGTRIIARSGRIEIGRDVEIGEDGGFTLRADRKDITISIGDAVRLMGGSSLALNNRIGRGAQIIGAIRAQNCRLGDGGSFRDPEPDSRSGVLKGHGVAGDIDVPQGYVIEAFSLFADVPLRWQSFFHPRTSAR